MERVNPSDRDPRFPNRPTHPDFIILSEAVQDNDEMSERNIGFDRVMSQFCDHDSLAYITIERAKFLAAHLGLPESMLSTIAGAMIDGFALGVAFERRKNAAQPTQ